MSILIKGMDMPTKDGVITIRIWGNGLVERLESYHSWLLSGVRAQSIPPHGDLISRDALMELYADEDDLRLENMKVPIAVIRQNIMDAPTIIPADKEGE